MKTVLLAAAAVACAATANLSPASATNAPTGTSGATTGTPHYEWQYHYVGHHPRYEGHWVLVK
jgi:Spy/CpxP family protein refolding chaperone